MSDWLDITGFNQGEILSLYERYLSDPASVDPATRAAFERWTPPGAPRRPDGADAARLVGAVNLADAIRRYGHLAAAVDPLATEPRTDPVLLPATHGIAEADLARLPAEVVGGPLAESAGSAAEAIARLRRVYCGPIGYDYAHIFAADERAWLHAAAESGQFREPADPIDADAILERLTEVEVFERFLHRTFPGRTRFSLEGLDMLVPLFDELIGEAAEQNVTEMLVGMAHRGRLNVLAHVLGKPYEQILAEFKDPPAGADEDGRGWTGDVKYHKGARRAVKGGAAMTLHVDLPPNPSHLEAIDPVIEGRARAAGTDVDRVGPGRFDPRRTLPMLVHGDAAFPGQGVVAETLNLSRLPGYQTGGTIHVIANNQLGFTAEVTDVRSTFYASGLARGFKIPIVHVNADEPEAVVEAARLALAYRMRFGRDFVIDLIGYRRYGHNEGDEPGFTQPRLYHTIASHPRVRRLWADRLIARGLVSSERADELERVLTTRLQSIWAAIDAEGPRAPDEASPSPPPPGAAARADTRVSRERLRRLNDGLRFLPEGFVVHPKLVKVREERRRALARDDERAVDWATAEELAFASILRDGTAIRLTGQDAGRGTFSQRHAVLHDSETGEPFVPLQTLPDARAAFDVYNSPVTEQAVLAFEFGYNIQAPQRLVIWEAQYGDFVNLAQTVIDEFIVSARDKWGQTPSLVLLLPHGDEGQGPDHASARPERFLQLAANLNLRVANCTTAAQYFHLLRRQALLLREDPLPLVVLTPKSLLRHPMTRSTPRELAETGWRPVLDDLEARQHPAAVTRLLLCSGKIFVDLRSSEPPGESGARQTAVCRLEQLYPFPEADLREVLVGYPNLREIVWVQEETENMGAWSFVRPHLDTLIEGRPERRRWRVEYVGRPPSASPAEGSAARYAATQREIVARALRVGIEIEEVRSEK